MDGQMWAGREGLSGDHQYDRKHHGGPERALLMYSADHYPRWRSEWGRKDVGPGAFGENLTVQRPDRGHRLHRRHLPDRGGPHRGLLTTHPLHQSGSRRHGLPDLVKTIVQNHRSGWYLRVLQEGWLEAGMPVSADRPALPAVDHPARGGRQADAERIFGKMPGCWRRAGRCSRSGVTTAGKRDPGAIG